MSSSLSSSHASKAASKLSKKLLASRNSSTSLASTWAFSNSNAVSASETIPSMRFASEICSFASLTACDGRAVSQWLSHTNNNKTERACIMRCASSGESHRSPARQRCSRSGRSGRVSHGPRHTRRDGDDGPASLAALSGTSTTCAR